jgi:hypothetical protein
MNKLHHGVLKIPHPDHTSDPHLKAIYYAKYHATTPLPTFREKNFLSYRDRTSVVCVVFRIKLNFLAWWGCGFMGMRAWYFDERCGVM